MDKDCITCVVVATECETCRGKMHYREAEKPRCLSCRWCDSKAYHNGKWYCSNPKVSIFAVPINTDLCFEARRRKE